ncbi:hypothetical protein [Marinoscillum sp. 108]|uniref:L-2-amino-thiazoline-4-carboxylic acid hydrolase n=1 Tax=Marinoscillum luteum TaxID=861051 RepID=A0ABW7N630_9BACT|nr:hypothetical protein [Marinoscillum sp. 108]VXD21470.1 conserved hypothetical protein [Marinoscillum sp. 108]
MAEYKSFEDNIEAGGNELPIIAMGSLGQNQRKAIIEKHGLNANTGAWNNLQSLLDAMKEVASTIGEMNLFLIGKAIIEGTQFPPMDSLENALRSIDVAYHMNHRKNGQPMFNPNTGQMTEGIGHYKLARYDAENKEALLVCHTPYPAKFEEGLVVQIVRMFKPKDSLFTKVKLDETKETKSNGGDSCTFIINW